MTMMLMIPAFFLPTYGFTTLLLYVWYKRKPQNAMHYFLFGGQKGGESKLLFVIVNEWAGKGIPRGRRQYNLLRSLPSRIRGMH